MTRYPLLAASTIAGTLLASTVLAQDEQSAMAQDQEMGKRFEVKAENLPEPYVEKAVRNAANVVPRNAKEPTAPTGSG